ncbi:MAG: Crp/Fnr family transcriptional regulator [Planctomycetes bacterium]|nr:Crp/Fnr family transcriptional regulator [Planctomycetota bacterium]
MQKFTPDEIKQFLAEDSLFRGANSHAIDQLARLALQRSVAAGCTLFSMGQPCDALHFVVDGCGLLIQLASDGRERILHRAIPGEMIGAVPFFDGKRYPASFVAETDCLVMSFHREKLISLLASDPSLSFGVIGGLVNRLRKMVSIVEQISFNDTTRRLWDFLIESSRNTGSHTFPRAVDNLPTRELMAHAIGTVREVVSRRLSHLVDTGHIRIEGRRLVLLKPLE